MRSKLMKKMCFCFIGFFVSAYLFCQSKYFSWDFADCEIKDILYAVSVDTGISIVADDTVKGLADLKFAGSEFSVAFDSFLSSARLYVEKKENVWTVSRYSLHRDNNGRLSLDVCDLSPAVILEKVSLFTDSVITYDSLPGSVMSIHFKDLSEEELLNSLAKRFGSYEVVKNNVGFHLSKKSEYSKIDFSNSYVNLLQNEDGSFTVDLRDALFSEVVDLLFSKADCGGDFGFCLLSGSDVRIQRCNYVGTDFENTLEKLCAQNGFSCVKTDGIFYIYGNESARNEIAFGERQWHEFFLKYTSAEIILPVIYARVGKVENTYIPQKNSFYVKVNSQEALEIQKLISEIDLKVNTYFVEPKYIKTEELLTKLPSSIKKENIYFADNNCGVYFKGTEYEYKSFCEQLELIDKPEKRIKYDLLILQYDEGSQSQWSSSFNADRLAMGNRNSMTAQIGSVMNLNMNVISAFGLNFAASLQSSIEDNSAKVYADTTLCGISGKQIRFKNTNTYRYRDNNLDPETGKPIYSGITKEIISGITLDILGWVSGENMVTSSVTATFCRQGIDTSSSTGNPPPTTEKTVTTEVCCKTGEPVVLSGLVLNADTFENKRTPFISKIPIIGKLFSAQEKTVEKTQMIIYLVPHVEGESDIRNDFVCSKEWAKGKIDKLLQEEKINELSKI